jgi:rhomboid family GlyGly-CTERM serine protease
MSSHDSRSENRFWQVVFQLANSAPIVTLVVAALAMVLAFVPGWGAAMSYQREAIALGQVWRLATGHLTHWNADHLLWDVIMFVLLSCFVEHRRRETAVWLLIGSAMLISLSLWCAAAEVDEYRGLSGIDSALFAYVAIVLARDALTARRFALAGISGSLIAGFVGKIAYELATGNTLFVDSRSAGFTPLPLVHLVGAAQGTVLAVGQVRFRIDRITEIPGLPASDERAAFQRAD